VIFCFFVKKRNISQVKNIVCENEKDCCNQYGDNEKKKCVIRHFALPPLKVCPRRYQGKVQA